MKHIVDLTTWPRRDNFAFFRDYLNPWYSVATELDCTEAYAAAKASKRSFFLHYLYALMRGVNEIPEFRYRTDAAGNVAWYDQVDVITPIAVPGRTFVTVRIPCCDDFDTFCEQAKAVIDAITEDTDPYAVNREVIAKGDYDVMLLSANPNLWFSSISCTQHLPGCPSEFPMSTAGKAVLRDGRLKMPFSIFVNHAFVDGAHLVQLFERMEQLFKQFAK